MSTYVVVCLGCNLANLNPTGVKAMHERIVHEEETNHKTLVREITNMVIKEESMTNRSVDVCDACEEKFYIKDLNKYYYKGEHYWWCPDCVYEGAVRAYSCNRGEHFGCGATDPLCYTCYPLTYRCPAGHEYLTPVPNGEPMPDCPEALPLGEHGVDELGEAYGCEFTAEYMAEIGGITNTDE